MSSVMSNDGQMGGGRSFDVVRFVTKVIDDFERRNGVKFDPLARRAVLDPAIQHRDDIHQEIQRGKVTEDEIRDAVEALLRFAKARSESSYIDETLVKHAMEVDCRYFPWC
jgi:hypothetical protein